MTGADGVAEVVSGKWPVRNSRRHAIFRRRRTDTPPEARARRRHLITTGLALRP